MNTLSYEFEFLTAGFPHGAHQARPELRAPSVRGQIRWWHAAIFGEAAAGNLFGALQSETQSSLVSTRVVPLSSQIAHRVESLPHKPQKKHRAPKDAIAPGSRFRLDLVPRRAGPEGDQPEELERSVSAWLLLGGIGQRSNRGAGSVWPVADAPADFAEFARRSSSLLEKSKLRAAVLSEFFDHESILRLLAGDFLDSKAFLDEGRPFGSASPRKPSPLKLSAIRLSGKLRLVALWDNRHSPGDLRAGVEKLSASGKHMGTVLEEVLEQLAPSSR